LSSMQLKIKVLIKILLIIAVLITGCLLSVQDAFSAGTPSETGAAKTGYVNIIQVIDYFNLDYEFDELAGVLILKKGTQTLILHAGSKAYYYGDRTYFSGIPVRIETGRIFVSSEIVDFIIKRFVRKRVKWEVVNGNFVVSGRTLIEKEVVSGRKGTELTTPRRKIDIIIIDPGHGGKDPGGIGYGGIREKDIVLDISKLLQKELRRSSSKKVIMTRKEDVFVSLEERSKIANGNNNGGNSIFVSIHANVALDKSSKGFESYYLSLHPFGENARDVAEIENAVITYEDKPYADYLKEVLNRVVDVEYRKESMKLASYINQGIAQMVNQAMPNRGVKGAFFYVLKESKMVAVLVEIGFITNKKEAELLKSREYQTKLAKGIASGIISFIDEFERTNGFTEGY